MDFGINFKLIFDPFGINFLYFFGIDFFNFFGMPFFQSLMENGRQNDPRDKGALPMLASQGRPKTLQKRIRDATSIFHRFGIDLGSHFGDIIMILAQFFHDLKRQCRQTSACISH